MVAGPPLGIREFLLAFAAGEDAEPLRDAVERHQVRTMTVISMHDQTAITRCPECPGDARTPCGGLRLLAQPYAHHPAYRDEWAP